MNVNEYINKKINNYDDRSKDLTFIADEEYFFYSHHDDDHEYFDLVKIKDNKTGDIFYYVYSDESIFFTNGKKKEDYPHIDFTCVDDWAVKVYWWYREFHNEI